MKTIPIKDTSRAHIARAMSSCISDDDLKMVKSVLKQKSIGHSSDDDDYEEEPKKKNAREMRSSQFTKMIGDRISNKSRKRKACDISVQYIDVPCRFNNKLPIATFTRKRTLQYVKLENVSKMKKVSEYKCLLARLELVDRGSTKEEVDGLKKWSQLKTRLEEIGMGANILLKDKTNMDNLEANIEASKKKAN